MRGEKSLLEWETLLEKQAGSRESQALSQANSQFLLPQDRENSYWNSGIR